MQQKHVNIKLLHLCNVDGNAKADLDAKVTTITTCNFIPAEVLKEKQ